MSQEIVEAVRDIEREKGIESGTLVAALEDALLAAYKKIPGSSRHATAMARFGMYTDAIRFIVFSHDHQSGSQRAPARPARQAGA